MHEILSIRQQVFIKEQKCVYCDADTYDKSALHLSGRDSQGIIVAYSRLCSPGSRFLEPSIGRVLTCDAYRGQGIARTTVTQTIEKSRECYPGQSIKLSAQIHLQEFYATFGFLSQGEVYDEDGIDHIDMLLKA